MPDSQTILMLATGVFLVLNGLTGARAAAMDDALPDTAETADNDDDSNDDADRDGESSNDEQNGRKA